MSKGGRVDDFVGNTGIQEGGVADLKSKLQSNRLVYSFPPSLGVCKARSLVRNVFNAPASGYTDRSQMVIHLNPGEAFVNPATSYLTFQGGVVSASAYTWGVGSSLNAFLTATLTSASGTEIERVERVNQTGLFLDRVWGEMTRDQMSCVGRAMGYSDTPVACNGATAAELPVWVIPLGKIFGLFRSQKLLPSQLLSGAKIELTLDVGSRAVVLAGSVAAPTLTILNPSIVLDTYILEDSVMLALQRVCAKDGLEYAFQTVDNNQASSTTTGLDLDIRKAVSVANSIIVARYPAPQATAILESTIDTFSTGANLFTQFQFNLGSLYMPNQTMVKTSTAAAEAALTEFYYNVLYATENYSATTAPLTITEYATKLGCVAATLERSTLLSLSGMPVALSKQLHLSATFSSSGPHVIYSMLNYTALAKIYLDRVLIRN
jgi:hypothetical protein